MKLRVLALLMCGQWAFATGISDSKHDLKTINIEIKSLRKTLEDERSKAIVLSRELQNADVKIGYLSKQLAELREQRHFAETKLGRLHRKEKTYEKQIDQQRYVLVKQIRSAYQLGKHGFIQLLLNQDHPDTVDRTLSYFKIINQKRISVLHQLKNNVENLLSVQQNIQSECEAILALSEKYRTQSLSLDESKQKRQTLLSQLTQTIDDQAQQLQEKISNKNKLEQVIQQLQVQALMLEQARIPLVDLQGKLAWPTMGRITEHYHTKLGNSSLKTNGILIQAESGQPVRASYPGRVVFANWLSGFGLLLIIQHNAHYMTLYGHNQSLYKKEGDNLSAGEIIATVGKSGGFNQSGLYFEIRKDGKPVNPEHWLK